MLTTLLVIDQHMINRPGQLLYIVAKDYGLYPRNIGIVCETFQVVYR